MNDGSCVGMDACASALCESDEVRDGLRCDLILQLDRDVARTCLDVCKECRLHGCGES